jgi:hypothetical protein
VSSSDTHDEDTKAADAYVDAEFKAGRRPKLSDVFRAGATFARQRAAAPPAEPQGWSFRVNEWKDQYMRRHSNASIMSGEEELFVVPDGLVARRVVEGHNKSIASPPPTPQQAPPTAEPSYCGNCGNVLRAQDAGSGGHPACTTDMRCKRCGARDWRQAPPAEPQKPKPVAWAVYWG